MLNRFVTLVDLLLVEKLRRTTVRSATQGGRSPVASPHRKFSDESLLVTLRVLREWHSELNHEGTEKARDAHTAARDRAGEMKKGLQF